MHRWRVIIVMKGELESTLNSLERDHFEIVEFDFTQPDHDRIIGFERNQGGGGIYVERDERDDEDDNFN